MNMKSILYVLTVVFCLASCERQLPLTGTERSGGTQPIRFSTGIGSLDYSIQTRAYAESSFSTMRTGGIGVLGYNTGSAAFNKTSPSGIVIDNAKLTSDDGWDWRFTDSPVVTWNTASSDKYSFLAYHPYLENLSRPELALPLSNTIDDCIDYLVARPVYDQTSKDGVNLAFGHIFSKVALSLRLSTAYAGQKYTLTSVKFSGVMDYPTFSLSQDRFTGAAVSHDITAGAENISSGTLAAISDRTTVDPVVISPYDYAANGKGIRISLTFDYSFTNSASQETVRTFTKDIVISKDMERNRSYNVNVTFIPDEEGGVAVAATFEDYRETEDLAYNVIQADPVNLSEGGRANSYIIPKAGKYYFDASYKGNSTSETVGDISNAEVLWETYGYSKAISPGDLISEVKVSGKTISFLASDLKGNALIAAKDASGNILWSWHIWMTDRPSDHIYKNGAGTMMDRNLGATSALQEDGVKTYGLLYQWGRKDPFMGPGLANYASYATNTGVWPEKVSGPQTTEWADANPMTFITHSQNWLTPVDDTRWNTTDEKKTINDPCPPGYKMPKGTSSGLWKTAFGSTTSKPPFNLGYDFGASDTYMSFTSESTCWYPAVGYMTGSGSITEVGSNGRYWSASTSSGYYASYMMLTSTVANGAAGTPRSYGQSTRCAKE